MAEDKRGPGLRFPPPLIPVAAVGLGWLLHRWLPLSLGGAGWQLATGIALLGLAFSIALLALLQFLRARTHVEPWHPTRRIIRGGLYARSRNPIYLAFCIATAGAGLWLDNAWVLIATPLVALLLQRLVIRREEAYLEAKFGAEYRDYCDRVRRWL